MLAVAVAAVCAGGAAVVLGRGGGAAVDVQTRAPRAAAPARPPRRVRGPHDAAVPILMYHVIGAPGPGLRELYVSPADFRAQVAWLAAHGFHAVTQHAVLRFWRDGIALPAKPVVLSFDDGYPGDVDVALPVLRARRWPAVLNLQVGNLVPARVRALVRAGWEIDAHTFTHPDLTTVSPAQLRREVAGSRAWIRGVFHVPVEFFCYPAGRYDAAVVAEVRRAGYAGATTTTEGLASPREGMWTLDRVRVNGSDGVAGLAAKLADATVAPPSSAGGAG